MNHAANCSAPAARRDLRGVMRCPSCKYLADAAPAPHVMVVSSYRCREHLEQPVSWRGTGCVSCAAQRTRRKASATRDDTEQMETYR